LTAPNYTASHELLHLLMILSGFPQVFFSLTTGNPDLDQQLMIMGTELYDIVSHEVVVSEQRKHGLITPEINDLYLKGVDYTLKPEPAERDDEMTLRTLTLWTRWSSLALITRPSTTSSPRTIRKASRRPGSSMKRLLPNRSRRHLASAGTWSSCSRPSTPSWKPGTCQRCTTRNSPRCPACCPSVQLSLQVRQIFELYHSDMHEKTTQRRGYVGFNRADNQNAFVLPAPKPKEDTPDYYTNIYNMTVEDLFKQLKMPYILR
jgi:hypothetical protein